MEVNAQKAEAAKACFDFNPLVNTLYVTSNLGCFLKRNDAVNHARGLDDKEIDVFIRADEEAVIDADQTESATDESETAPDARLAVVKAGGGSKGKSFTKAAKAVAAETAPVDPAATDETAPAEEAPAPAATDENITEETPAPAATDENITEEAPALVATDENITEEAPAPVATDENITEELTELVDKIENILHLKK
jgi:hypothetical protein